MIQEISSLQLQELLLKEGFLSSSISLSDEFYAIPTEESIQGFGKRYGKFLFDAGVNVWSEEVWDCDDFALLAKALANLDNGIWRQKTGNDVGLAFGIAWVSMKEGGHAINMAIGQNDAGLFEVHYYEPQMQLQENFGDPFVWLKKQSRDYFVSPRWCYL